MLASNCIIIAYADDFLYQEGVQMLNLLNNEYVFILKRRSDPRLSELYQIFMANFILLLVTLVYRSS